MAILTPMKRTKSHFNNFEKSLDFMFDKTEKQNHNNPSQREDMDCDFLRNYKLLNNSEIRFKFHFKDNKCFLQEDKQSIEIIYTVGNQTHNSILLSINEFTAIMKELNLSINAIESSEKFEEQDKIDDIILNTIFKSFSASSALEVLESTIAKNNKLELDNIIISKTNESIIQKRINEKEKTILDYANNSEEVNEIAELEKLLLAKKEEFKVKQQKLHSDLMLDSEYRLLKETQDSKLYLVEKIENSAIIINQELKLSKPQLSNAVESIIEKQGY